MGRVIVALLAVALSIGVVGCRGVAAQQEEATTVRVLQESLDVRGRAARTFDLSQFSQYFVDDPNVPLTPAQAETVIRLAPGTVPVGFLTYMRVYYEDWRRGAEAFQRVEQAVRASQKPDPSDVRAAVPPREDAMRVPGIKVLKFEMSPVGRAYIEADVDGFLFKVTLVKRGDRWYIAGEQRAMMP